MTPIDASDRRDKLIGFLGEPSDLARVTQHAARQGVAPTVWARNALLDALAAETGYVSTVRRRVDRRPNRQPRERQAGPPGLWIRVSGTEKDEIGKLTASKGLSITDWAWGVLEQAMKRERKRR